MGFRFDFISWGAHLIPTMSTPCSAKIPSGSSLVSSNSPLALFAQLVGTCLTARLAPSRHDDEQQAPAGTLPCPEPYESLSTKRRASEAKWMITDTESSRILSVWTAQSPDFPGRGPRVQDGKPRCGPNSCGDSGANHTGNIMPRRCVRDMIR